MPMHFSAVSEAQTEVSQLASAAAIMQHTDRNMPYLLLKLLSMYLSFYTTPFLSAEQIHIVALSSHE